jgi:hypothetical protein
MFQPLPHTTLSLPCPLRVHTSPVWLLHSPLRLLCHPVLACTTSSVWCHNHAAIPPAALTLPCHRDTLARASCHVVPLLRRLTHPRRCRHTRPREISSSCWEVSKDGRVGSGCEEIASMRTSTVRGKEGVWRYRSRVWLPRGVGRCRRCSKVEQERGGPWRQGAWRVMVAWVVLGDCGAAQQCCVGEQARATWRGEDSAIWEVGDGLDTRLESQVCNLQVLWWWWELWQV